MLRVLALLMLTMMVAGCTQSTDGEWWVRPGIQCEPAPWEEWADANQRDRQQTAAEPYQRDAHIEALVTDYYEEQGMDVDDVHAFFDDMARMQVCGSPNGWQYWMLSSQAPPAADGWTKADGEPEV